MTNWRLYALLTVVLAILWQSACQAQKITVDPNMSGASRLVSDAAVDHRLSQKVTYEAWHTSLKTIVEDLSKSTGVELLAGYSKKDWQVRDRRMNVSVKDATLAELMSSIARVMKFRWSKSDTLTPPVYRLVADRKLIAGLQAEASRLDEELKKEAVRRRTGLVDALAKVADLSGPELQALRQENPYLYMCSQSGFAKTVTQMMADEPALREAFVNGSRTARVDIGLFKPATRQLCAENVRNMWPLDRITQDHPPLKDGFADAVAAGQVYFDCIRPLREYTQSKRLFYYGSVCVHSPEDGHFLGDMRDPYAKATRAWATACLEAVERDEPPGRGWSSLAPRYFPVEEEEAKDLEVYLMFDPLVEHPDDPDLHKEVTMNLSDDEQKALMDEIRASGGRSYGRAQYQAMLKLLAQSSQMNVVSDSYCVVLVRSTGDIPEKAELVTVLEKLAEAYRLNWEKHSCVIEFRRRDWFRRRASQLPDEWLGPWRQELLKKGAPSLDTYVQIAALTDDQVEESINSDPLLDQVIGGSGGDRFNRDFCRFYLQLTDSQRGLILNGLGLDTRLLSPAQQQPYSDMFLLGWQNQWRTEEFVDPPAGATVTITAASKPKPNNSTNYTFTALLAGRDSGERDRKWTITLRKISVPQKDEGRPSGGK